MERALAAGLDSLLIKVPVEMHPYSRGGEGYALRPSHPLVRNRPRRDGAGLRDWGVLERRR